ncbi:hypothetical protein N7450_007942 [Penicillium hetheringtonii]|uniref:Uncharacterized protein n=1 Tax=Penicillium hetheringtonii TaxID=911720 RepID=A0AAD6DH16_9EURO|nr:hypothetical protein N7450_007942 [Penicillium hetheringtonii]
MFRSHSERTKRKQKQKQKQSTIPMSFSGDSSGTKNSSTHTLPVQTSTDSIPSVVTPESKPEAPVLSDPELSPARPSLAFPSESRPVGGRRGKSSDDDTNGAATRGGELVHGREGAISSAGLQMPGQLLNDPDEKGALKIKVHLNLHAKVRLDLDAQIYGDVVIGLL